MTGDRSLPVEPTVMKMYHAYRTGDGDHISICKYIVIIKINLIFYCHARLQFSDMLIQ